MARFIASHRTATKLYWAQWKSLKLKGGVLHRLWESPVGYQIVPQVVLPKSLRRYAFLQLHNLPTAWDLHEINETVDYLRQRFYWPHLRQDAQSWCGSCNLYASHHEPRAENSTCPNVQVQYGGTCRTGDNLYIPTSGWQTSIYPLPSWATNTCSWL